MAILTEKVKEIHHWTDKTFSFKTTRNLSFRFKNGEFAMIGLKIDDKPLLRAYSVVSPNHEDHLEFLSIKVHNGPLTSKLQHIDINNEILINSKSTGTLVCDYLLPGRNLYLFSTGTGLAPFMSIVRDPEKYEKFENAYAHIYYKKPYSYYKLRFEYRFLGDQVEGGAGWNNRNSGVMLHSQSPESNDFGQYFPISIEIQLLGGLGEGKRTTRNLCTPGTAVEINGEINYTHCINSDSKTYHGDRWVSAEVIVYGEEQIIHIIENDTVLRYKKPQIGGGFSQPQLGDKDWTSNGIESKDYWLSKEGEFLNSGYIALQADSHAIDFKNIKLLNLCGCMDVEAKNFKSHFIKEDNSKCIY